MGYIKEPEKISETSMDIISRIIREERPDYEFNNPMEEAIIKRAIHTTADFGWMFSLKFKGNILEKVQEVIREGGTIYTDTTMALAGINKKLLDRYQVKYHCYVNDEAVWTLAKEKNITRSMAGIELAAQNPGKKLFVIGNAPTAIFKILEMVEEKKLSCEGVIGVPVGFVGAVESKQALYESDLPAICALGRKGGSNVAAAIMNAIQYTME